MKLLIPAPSTMEALGNTTESTDGEGLTEAERRLQREEEKYEVYDRIYMGQLSNVQDSDTDTDELNYTYFG